MITSNNSRDAICHRLLAVRRAIEAWLYLVELQHVKQVKELAVLLAVLQLAVVLLQAVECQLCLVVHKYFHGLHGTRRQRDTLGKVVEFRVTGKWENVSYSNVLINPDEHLHPA